MVNDAKIISPKFEAVRSRNSVCFQVRPLVASKVVFFVDLVGWSEPKCRKHHRAILTRQAACHMRGFECSHIAPGSYVLPVISMVLRFLATISVKTVQLNFERVSFSVRASPIYSIFYER